MAEIEEINELEQEMRLAELEPNPFFFEKALAEDAILDWKRAKTQVVEAHRPNSGKGQKFKTVEMSDFEFVNHGSAVVVTCRGTYEGEMGVFTLKFMRVWLKKEGRWQIIAGSVAKIE